MQIDLNQNRIAASYGFAICLSIYVRLYYTCSADCVHCRMSLYLCIAFIQNTPNAISSIPERCYRTPEWEMDKRARTHWSCSVGVHSNYRTFRGWPPPQRHSRRAHSRLSPFPRPLRLLAWPRVIRFHSIVWYSPIRRLKLLCYSYFDFPNIKTMHTGNALHTWNNTNARVNRSGAGTRTNAFGTFFCLVLLRLYLYTETSKQILTAFSAH